MTRFDSKVSRFKAKEMYCGTVLTHSKGNENATVLTDKKQVQYGKKNQTNGVAKKSGVAHAKRESPIEKSSLGMLRDG